MLPLHDNNPTTLQPYVTITLIVACVLIFIWQLSLGDSGQYIVYALGLIPAVLFGGAELPAEVVQIPAVITVVSSMFLHGGWMHLIGNMLYLWVFGNNVEDSMGHVRFLIFYLLCGVAAAMAQALPNPDSTIPMIGASGAISGVLGAYLMLYPHARVLVGIPVGFFIYTARLPAIAVLVFWFVLQVISNVLAGAKTGGGVAWGAHIGGFIAGMILIPFFTKHRLGILNSFRR